jgi:hypothetical protein
VFTGVLILVLGTYATLYAANEATNEDRIEFIEPQRDHFDDVARMTLIQVNKLEVDDIPAGKRSVYQKARVGAFHGILPRVANALTDPQQY